MLTLFGKEKLKMVDIDFLSDEGATQVLSKILTGLERFVERNPDIAKFILESVVYDFIEPISEDDFFGTEGWEHALGIED